MKFYKSDDKHIIEIYDKNKIILKAEYKIIGIYRKDISMWIYSQCIPFMEKDLVKKIDFNNKNKNQKTAEQEQYFMNPFLYIKKDDINNIFLKFLEKHTKQIIVNNKDHIIEFISIENILEIK